MADARNIALLVWKTQREESRKIAENRAKLARRQLYRYLRRRCPVSSVFLLLLTWQLFNAPQVYVEFGVKAGLSPFGRRPAKAGAIMIG